MIFGLLCQRYFTGMRRGSVEVEVSIGRLEGLKVATCNVLLDLHLASKIGAGWGIRPSL